LLITFHATAQQPETPAPDTLNKNVPEVFADSSLRIINLNPYFTLHVDSTLNYDIDINRSTDNYFWYLRNSPVGMQIDRSNGHLFFKADKSFFKSGKLKYDQEYKVQLGVQNLQNPTERVDTSFHNRFLQHRNKCQPGKTHGDRNPFVEEGDSIRFKIQCENGSFPVEQITLNTNIPISNYKPIHNCDDEFAWMVPFDFIRDDDTTKQKKLDIQFISADKFFNKDTSVVKIVVKPGINYPIRNVEHKRVSEELQKYVLSLKLTFYVISKSVKTNKSTRNRF
jgi:hypothetical protein